MKPMVGKLFGFGFGFVFFFFFQFFFFILLIMRNRKSWVWCYYVFDTSLTLINLCFNKKKKEQVSCSESLVGNRICLQLGWGRLIGDEVWKENQ